MHPIIQLRIFYQLVPIKKNYHTLFYASVKFGLLFWRKTTDWKCMDGTRRLHGTNERINFCWKISQKEVIWKLQA